MEVYLWDFSFDELFYEENELSSEVNYTEDEQQMIDSLRNYFEEIASQSKSLVKKMTDDEIFEYHPELIKKDMILQLCLLYSLSIKEWLFTGDFMIELIENEVYQYFHEYRIFGKRYKFERYSIMNKTVDMDYL